MAKSCLLSAKCRYCHNSTKAILPTLVIDRDYNWLVSFFLWFPVKTSKSMIHLFCWQNSYWWSTLVIALIQQNLNCCGIYRCWNTALHLCSAGHPHMMKKETNTWSQILFGFWDGQQHSASDSARQVSLVCGCDVHHWLNTTLFRLLHKNIWEHICPTWIALYF